MKYFLLFILLEAIGLAIWWLAGNEFVRGPKLVNAITIISFMDFAILVTLYPFWEQFLDD